MHVDLPVPHDLNWFKSSYSGANATECVEAACMPSGVLIRDSKQPEGPWVAVSHRAWRRFVTARPQ
ncbi:DUF397 domain-containing protein [Streptomyces sp. NPDC021356]|uniref:DUF397 domain-containing protein n=1 Tax=Streptomyces sp. NPDC021356 TaxID=3154900 RepID=UPI0033F1DF60